MDSPTPRWAIAGVRVLKILGVMKALASSLALYHVPYVAIKHSPHLVHHTTIVYHPGGHYSKILNIHPSYNPG